MKAAIGTKYFATLGFIRHCLKLTAFHREPIAIYRGENTHRCYYDRCTAKNNETGGLLYLLKNGEIKKFGFHSSCLELLSRDIRFGILN